jgi:hypothetical protein
MWRVQLRGDNIKTKVRTKCFPGGKARPGRNADHSPPSSAEVKYEQELYLPLPLPNAFMACSGITLPLREK